MARRFEAVDELLDDALTLPVKGHTGGVQDFRFPSPDAETGARIARTMDVATRVVSTGEAPADTAVLDDAAEVDLYLLALGDQYDPLHAWCDWAWLKHTAMTVVFWVVADMETAENYWASGDNPEALAPSNRAERRAGASASGTAKSTPRRGSTSGTKAAPRKRAAKG